MRQAGAGEVRTTVGAGLKLQQGGGGIFKTAAVAVLRMERRLMATGEITKCALEFRFRYCLSLSTGAPPHGHRQDHKVRPACAAARSERVLCSLACSMFPDWKEDLAPSVLRSIMQVAALLMSP